MTVRTCKPLSLIDWQTRTCISDENEKISWLSAQNSQRKASIFGGLMNWREGASGKMGLIHNNFICSSHSIASQCWLCALDTNKPANVDNSMGFSKRTWQKNRIRCNVGFLELDRKIALFVSVCLPYYYRLLYI